MSVLPVTEPKDPIIEEIVAVAVLLRPRAFFGRIDYWRRGSLPTGAGGDYVSGSRTPAMPELDRTDRELQQASRQYRDDIEDARRLLAHAHALQVKYLYAVEVASPELVDLVTDSPVCRKCKGTKEMWTRAKRKTPWRIKAGLGPCCYSAWNAAGRPDLPPMDARGMEEASA